MLGDLWEDKLTYGIDPKAGTGKKNIEKMIIRSDVVSGGNPSSNIRMVK